MFAGTIKSLAICTSPKLEYPSSITGGAEVIWLQAAVNGAGFKSDNSVLELLKIDRSPKVALEALSFQVPTLCEIIKHLLAKI